MAKKKEKAPSLVEQAKRAAATYQALAKPGIKGERKKRVDAAVKTLKRLARLAVNKRSPLHEFHPGEKTLYRAGKKGGASWSRSKGVATGFGTDYRIGKKKLAVATKQITAKTPALDIEKLTTGAMRMHGDLGSIEQEIFVAGAGSRTKRSTATPVSRGAKGKGKSSGGGG